ncbi:hypothetical protein Pint_10431 [Pistacia integerrima]|uniref:Uncharacterized protein n=1 Tax=Pistacia integerrima TaxID=434235 RepID=A0ACC0XH01_9ROSI|nr:hypothetical protein Pint_10431 [Pistacia integerrima]
MNRCLDLNLPSLSSTGFGSLNRPRLINIRSQYSSNRIDVSLINRSSLPHHRFYHPVKATTTTTTSTMAAEQSGSTIPSLKLLFVEMGVGYDQHGQDVTAAAMRACRDAISSNSIPAFRRGSIPGVTFEQMKLLIKLGVPHSLQQSLDIERIKSVFPYSRLLSNKHHSSRRMCLENLAISGKILNVEVVDGGLICSSGVYVEEMGDKNDDCYIVNAAVYVGY